jgi:hypothetical protein
VNGIPFLAPSLGIGVKYRWIWLEFNPERSNMIKFYGDLAEDLLCVAVQYSRGYDNIVFKPLILRLHEETTDRRLDSTR